MALFDAKPLRRFARRLVPPVILDAFGALRPNETHGFHGRYDDFGQALSAAGGSGYASAELVNSTLEGTRKVRADLRDEPKRTRDLWTVQNLGAVLYAMAGRTWPKLRVLDFGGGMGVHYMTLRHLLPISGSVRWTVCETSATVRIAREQFASDELDFIDDLDRLEGSVDLVFTSGALQYTDDPARYFERLARLSDLVVWNRAPFIDGDADVLTLQSVTRGGYAVKLPAWFLGDEKWKGIFERAGLNVALRWQENIDSATWESRPVSYQGIVGTRSR